MKQGLILISYGCLFTTMGMKVVLLPALFMAGGLAEAWIGAIFTMELFAGMAMSLVLPKLCKRLGVAFTYALLTSLCAGSALAFLMAKSLGMWIVLSFTLGLGMMGAFTLLQSMYNQTIDNHNRGWCLAISTMAVCTGLTMGPIIVGWLNGSLFWGLLIAAAMALAAIVPIWSLHQKQEAPEENRPVKWMYFLKREPIVFLAKFSQEFAVTAIFALGVVYLVSQGHSTIAAGYGLSAFSASAVIDLIMGRWIDRYVPRRIMQLGALGFSLCLAVMYLWAAHFWIMMAAFFGIGIFTGMMYLSLTTMLNNRFPKKTLVSANSAVQIAGYVGGIAGSVVSGLVMQASVGLFPVVLIAVLMGFVVASLWV